MERRYINIPILKGSILRLTLQEYCTAIKRGKAWKRAMQEAERLTHAQAQREAATLNWIDDTRDPVPQEAKTEQQE